MFQVGNKEILNILRGTNEGREGYLGSFMFLAREFNITIFHKKLLILGTLEIL